MRHTSRAAQVGVLRALRAAAAAASDADTTRVEISTVDGFQGREKEAGSGGGFSLLLKLLVKSQSASRQAVDCMYISCLSSPRVIWVKSFFFVMN